MCVCRYTYANPNVCTCACTCARAHTHTHSHTHTHKPFDIHGNQEGFIVKEKKTVFLLECYLVTRISREQAGNPTTCSFSLRYRCALLFKLILQKPLCLHKKKPTLVLVFTNAKSKDGFHFSEKRQGVPWWSRG